jgi:parallel beta-helix repeat protein
MSTRFVRGLISVFTIFSMVTLGLIGLMVFPGFMQNASVLAKTIVVDPSGNGDYVTIHEAVENASIDDTIHVWAGYYRENINIYSSIKLIGNSSTNTTIDGANSKYPTIYIGASDVNVSGFKLVNSNWAAIEISYCSNVTIFNNTFKKNYMGIEMYVCDNVTFKSNNFTSSNYFGIYISDCTWCTVERNEFHNKYGGTLIEWSTYISVYENTYTRSGLLIEGWYQSHYNTHDIDSNNKVNGKTIVYWKNRNGGTVPLGAGQVIIASCSNILVQKQNCSDVPYGMIITYSDYIQIIDNIINHNFQGGLYCMYTENLTISKNNISRNENNGMRFESLRWSTIDNNKIDNNWQMGLYFQWECYHNEIIYNSFSNNNETGIYCSGTSYNNFTKNLISKNNAGILFDWECNYNRFFENNIVNNVVSGFEIFSLSLSNYIYHNNFISNPTQANDQGSNRWYVSGEGNYWSDYKGVDDGSGGRLKGDGIGDTSIPHPGSGLDSYPFTIPYGWRYPGEPILKDPGELDSDGNYSVSWVNNPRATGFILEEDDSELFDSPVELFNDTNTTYQIVNKPEGTYYYRLKVFNENYYSNWSNVVNITVDYLPNIPSHLHATVFPQGNIIYLSWDPNLVDTTCYELFYQTSGLSDWEMLANITHPDMNYMHDELTDGQVYLYKIRSRDSYWQMSAFSEPINTTPMDSMAPEPPKGLRAEPVSDSKIKLTWNASPEQDLAGYLLYMYDPVKNEPEEYKLIKTLESEEITYTVDKLVEQVKYYFKLQSFDEVPNNSTFSEAAWATPPDETHPQPPKGLKISNKTHNSMTISWEPNSEGDIVGYIVYSSGSSSGDFINISEMINGTSFIHSGLEENRIYYYKVRAIDDAGLMSLESDHIFGLTRLGPKQPEINNTIKNFEIMEDTKDEDSILLYHLFKDANNDVLAFRCEGQVHINVTINQIAGFVTLVPEKDWNGEETLTFYGNDSRFEISYEITITVTGVNDPPVDAKIIKPPRNFEVEEGKSIDLQGQCTDPDVPFGDVLVFTWRSSISDELGVGDNLTGVMLPPGEHIITLEVSDRLGEKTKASVKLLVIEKDDDSSAAASMFIITISAVSIVIIVIIFLSIFFILKRRHGKEGEEKSEDSTGMIAKSDESILTQTTTQQQVQVPVPVQTEQPVPGDTVFPEYIQRALEQQAQAQMQIQMQMQQMQIQQLQQMQQNQMDQQTLPERQVQQKRLPPKADE